MHVIYILNMIMKQTNGGEEENGGKRSPAPLCRHFHSCRRCVNKSSYQWQSLKTHKYTAGEYLDIELNTHTCHTDLSLCGRPTFGGNLNTPNTILCIVLPSIKYKLNTDQSMQLSLAKPCRGRSRCLTKKKII